MKLFDFAGLVSAIGIVVCGGIMTEGDGVISFCGVALMVIGTIVSVDILARKPA